MSEIIVSLFQVIGEFFVFGIPELQEKRKLRIYNRSILSDNITSIKEEQKKLGIYGQSIPLDDLTLIREEARRYYGKGNIEVFLATPLIDSLSPLKLISRNRSLEVLNFLKG
jgi:hypothetical protein